MIISLVILLLLAVVVILAAIKITNLKTSVSTKDGFSISQLFQYLILFGLVVVVSVGLSGLIGRALDFSNVIIDDKTGLALNITYVLVGMPFLLGVARWINKSFKQNPSEKNSLLWKIYLTAIGITSLIITLNSFHNLLSWLFQQESFSGIEISRTIIWTAVWLFHWKWLDAKSQKFHALVGTVIGLAILVVGLSGVIGHSLEEIFNLQIDNTIVQSSNAILNSLINLIIGFVTFYIYWVINAKKMSQDILWFIYLFLIGIASGFITLTVSLSLVIYNLLELLFISNQSQKLFNSTIAMSIGSLIAGFAAWNYHREIIVNINFDEAKPKQEVERIYNYIISSISLIASLYGLVMIFVAFIENLVPTTIVKSESSINYLLLAITLLIVGIPIWLKFWLRIEKLSIQNLEDRSSNTRRIFLLLLFGISSLVAVVSLIYVVFNFVISLLENQVGLETLRQTRFTLGILIVTLVSAYYHWTIYQDPKKFVKK